MCGKVERKRKLVSCADAVNVYLVGAAMTSWQHILQDPELRDLLLWQEQVYDPPVFDSIYKYDAIIQKCKTLENIRWTIGALLDLVTHHGTHRLGCSVRQLSGKQRLSWGKLQTRIYDCET